MEKASNSKDEYEIQLYGFPLRQLKYEHRLLVRSEIEKSVDSFVNKLTTKLKESNANPEILAELEEKSKSTSEEIFNSLTKYHLEFDGLVEKHLAIPDNVVLSENIDNVGVTEADEEHLKDEIEDMEKTFKQNQFMLVAMNCELQKYKAVEELIKKEDEIAEKLQQSFQEFNSNFGQNNIDEILNVR